MKRFIFRCPYLPLSLALLGVRSKNDGVYAGSPFLLFVVLGVSGTAPSPRGDPKGESCETDSPLVYSRSDLPFDHSSGKTSPLVLQTCAITRSESPAIPPGRKRSPWPRPRAIPPHPENPNSQKCPEATRFPPFLRPPRNRRCIPPPPGRRASWPARRRSCPAQAYGWIRPFPSVDDNISNIIPDDSHFPKP